MTQERRSKVQTLLIILSQRYQTPTWHAKRRSAVCSLQLWNGMVAQKEGKKKHGKPSPPFFTGASLEKHVICGEGVLFMTRSS
jgi:hypothetical protein